MNIARDVTGLIGNTPLVRINRLSAGCAAEVVAKLEFQNPAHSVKSRRCGRLQSAQQQTLLLRALEEIGGAQVAHREVRLRVAWCQ
jgi:cysteine synthase